MNSERGLGNRLKGLTCPARLAVLIAWCCTSVALAAEKPVLVLNAGGHTARVWKVLFSRDGKELISVSDDKTIRFWDVATGDTLRVLRPPIRIGVQGMLNAAALAPDGKTLAVGGVGFASDNWGGNIYMLSLATGQIERVLTGHERAIFALAFDSAGKRLISGSFDQTARIWNIGTGETEHVLRGHTKPIYGITFSPDGRHCATGSHDKTAAVWNVATGERLWTMNEHAAEVRSVAWSRDGQTLATASDDTTIRLWNVGWVSSPSAKPASAAYKTFNKLGEHSISAVTFTADGQRLLYAQGDGKTVKYVNAILDIATGRRVVQFDQNKNPIMHSTLSPDGTLAATADPAGEVFLWKTADGTRVHRLVGRGRVPWAAAWSPDGLGTQATNADRARIGWGNMSRERGWAGAKNPLERTFDLAALEFGPAPNDRFVRAQSERGSLSLVAGKPNQVGGVSSVSVLQGDRTLATLATDDPYDTAISFTLLPNDMAAVGTAFDFWLYNARTGSRLHNFVGHTGAIWAVSPSSDGKYLLSAGNDMTLRVWDPDRNKPLLSCFFAGDDWIVWTPEGYYAASPGGEKLMGWHVNNGLDQLASFYPASQFRSTLYRPDVIKLLLKTGSVERALDEADKARGRMTEKSEVAEVLPPQVRITSPVANHKAPQNTLAIRATATSVGKHPVTVLRLLLDGRPYQGQRGVQAIASPKLGDVNGEWTIELEPGKHKLKVLADSAVSQGISEEVEVVYVGGGELADQVRLPKLYVVAVGISDYPGDLKLNYAAKDAEALTVALKSHSKSLFREIEVQTITNTQATRAAVLKGLGWLRSNMTQNDYGIFFFAGHREFDNDGSVYFLPVDVDPQDLLTTAIGDDQFKKALAGIPGKMMTMLDSCNSGAVAGSQTGKRRAAGSSLTDDLVRDLVTDENGVVAMCSSTGREFSLENNEFRQGNFTLALVEGLSGKADFNKDGVVYLNELDTYVTDRVKELTKGQQHPVTGKPGSIRSFPLAKP